MDSTAVAAAHPNIALIKDWGNRDEALRIPQNGSISMTLAGLRTVTRVRFGDDLPSDSVVLHGLPATGEARARVTRHPPPRRPPGPGRGRQRQRLPDGRRPGVVRLGLRRVDRCRSPRRRTRPLSDRALPAGTPR